jgi:Tripartite tricarboxylate transporter TctB family
MSARIKSQKDFNAGLMFMIFGVLFVGIARGWFGGSGYPMGSAVRMGPAYFPTILGGLLFVLGVMVFLESFALTEAPPRPTRWRALLWILGSVVVFALLVGPFNAGLVAACLAIVVLSAYGGDEFKWRDAILSAVILSAASVGIFYYGLGLPFRLFPWS